MKKEEEQKLQKIALEQLTVKPLPVGTIFFFFSISLGSLTHSGNLVPLKPMLGVGVLYSTVKCIAFIRAVSIKPRLRSSFLYVFFSSKSSLYRIYIQL